MNSAEINIVLKEAAAVRGLVNLIFYRITPRYQPHPIVDPAPRLALPISLRKNLKRGGAYRLYYYDFTQGGLRTAYLSEIHEAAFAGGEGQVYGHEIELDRQIDETGNVLDEFVPIMTK